MKYTLPLVSSDGQVYGVIGIALKKDFGYGKNVLDLGCVALSIAITLIFSGRISNIGIGTVLSMLVTGRIVKLFSALPILENFLFDLKGNILEVTASDSELTLRTEIEVDTTQEEGKIAVPARHMIDLLKELPDQPVAISTASDSSIECKWTSGNSVLPFFPAEDYPEIKGTGDDAEKIEFPAESLIEGINSTIYATL